MESGWQVVKLSSEFCSDCGYLLVDQFGKVVLHIYHNLLPKFFCINGGTNWCSDIVDVVGGFLCCGFKLVFGCF